MPRPTSCDNEPPAYNNNKSSRYYRTKEDNHDEGRTNPNPTLGGEVRSSDTHVPAEVCMASQPTFSGCKALCAPAPACPCATVPSSATSKSL